MQVFVKKNNVEIMINAYVTAKNWLIKVEVITKLFGILVYVNKCDKSCNIEQHLDYKNCKCKRELIDKLVEECWGETTGKKIIDKLLCKSMQVSYNIHSIINHNIYENYKH